MTRQCDKKSIAYRTGLFHVILWKIKVPYVKKYPGFDTKSRAFLESYGTFKNSRTCCRSTTSYDIFYFNVYTNANNFRLRQWLSICLIFRFLVSKSKSRSTNFVFICFRVCIYIYFRFRFYVI